MSITILIADDEPAARYAMKKALSPLGCNLLEAENGEVALKCIQRQAPHLVFLDLTMPVVTGKQVLEKLIGQPDTGEIIVVTATDELDAAVDCIRLGATDYLTKPYEVERLRAIVKRNIARITTEEQLGSLRQQLNQQSALGALLGVSRSMRTLFQRIERAANAPLDILIRGETGTGKELIARELHRLSARNKGPFIAINTAAVNESLAESELFGHTKGAFTGADKARAGVFEQAAGGTLFLDEVGDMPQALQAKLLRVLQQREVMPVGGNRPIAVDARIICATHQDLNDAVADGVFREDLYYRLRGIELQAPPLRQRREDIILLTEFFLDQLASRSKSTTKSVDDAALARLLEHHWPGNVRELQQVITAAGAMAPGLQIEPDDLALGQTLQAPAQTGMPNVDGLPLTEAKALVVEWFERNAISNALMQHDGNVSATARQLGIHRQSLQQKMAHLKITR